MALELYHSPYRLTMYYQGLLSLIAPSQMMICGTLTLRYLFRIVLSGAVAKGEDFITSGSVTRQGVTGTIGTYTLPVSYLKFFTTVTGFGRDRAWGPIDSALTVCKNGLTSITLSCHESCSAYVITIGI